MMSMEVSSVISPSRFQLGNAVENGAVDGFHDGLKVFKDQYVAVGQLGCVQTVFGQGIEKQTLPIFH